MEVVPEISDKGAKPVIGVAIDLVGTVKLGLLDALSEGFTHTVQMLKMTISQFGTLIRDAVLGKANLDQVSGPIGIARIVGSAYEYGILCAFYCSTYFYQSCSTQPYSIPST